MVDVQEIPKVCAEDEEEKAAEGAKDDDKLNNEGGETDEAEFDCCSNLLEGFLETEKPTELEHAGEDGEGDGVVVVGVDLHRLLNRDKGISTCPLDLFRQLDHFQILREGKFHENEHFLRCNCKYIKLKT